MTNISKDLSAKDYEGYAKVVAKLYNTSPYNVNIGDMAQTVCIIHNIIHRAYSVFGAWHTDLCYPCFSRALANNERIKLNMKGTNSKQFAASRVKANWAQG